MKITLSILALLVLVSFGGMAYADNIQLPIEISNLYPEVGETITVTCNPFFFDSDVESGKIIDMVTHESILFYNLTVEFTVQNTNPHVVICNNVDSFFGDVTVYEIFSYDLIPTEYGYYLFPELSIEEIRNESDTTLNITCKAEDDLYDLINGGDISKHITTYKQVDINLYEKQDNIKLFGDIIDGTSITVDNNEKYVIICSVDSLPEFYISRANIDTSVIGLPPVDDSPQHPINDLIDPDVTLEEIYIDDIWHLKITGTGYDGYRDVYVKITSFNNEFYALINGEFTILYSIFDFHDIGEYTINVLGTQNIGSTLPETEITKYFTLDASEFSPSIISKSPEQSVMNKATNISCDFDGIVEGAVDNSYVYLTDVDTNFERKLLSPVEVDIYNDHNYTVTCSYTIDKIEYFADEIFTFDVTSIEPKEPESHPAVLYGQGGDGMLTITPPNPNIGDNIIVECTMPEEYGTSIQYGNEVDYHLEEFGILIYKDGERIWTVSDAYPNADTGKYGSSRPALIDPDTIDGGGLGEYVAYCGFVLKMGDGTEEVGWYSDNTTMHELKSGYWQNFEYEEHFTVTEYNEELSPIEIPGMTADQLFIEYRVKEINDKLSDTQSKMDEYLMRKTMSVNSLTSSVDGKVQFYLDKITQLEQIKENLLRVN